MDINFFGGKPLDAIGKTKRAMVRTHSAKRGSHTGVGFRLLCQSGIIVGFGKMHAYPVFARNVDGLGQVMFDLSAVVVLKQLGIRPV